MTLQTVPAYAGECRLKLYIQDEFGESQGLSQTRVFRQSEGDFQEKNLAPDNWFQIFNNQTHNKSLFRSLRFNGDCRGAAAELYEAENFSNMLFAITYDEFPQGILHLGLNGGGISIASLRVWFPSSRRKETELKN